MARSLTITYGSLQVGASQSNANIYLTDKYREIEDKDTYGVEFTLVCSAAASADLITAENHLKGQLGVPNQDFAVTLGTSRVAFSPDDNTGLLTRGSWRKVGAKTDTAQSSEWVCRVTLQKPANYDSRKGRREAEIEFDIDASERKIARFTGVYTAVPSPATGALAQYVSEIDDFCDAFLVAYGDAVTKWNLIRDNPKYDDENKVLRFERVYELINAGEAQGVVNHAALCLQQLSVIRSSFGDRRATDYADETSPFDFIRIGYRANVKISETTDLQALYDGTIRPHLLGQVNDTLIISREDVNLDKANNVVVANISGRASKSGVIESEVSETVAIDEGLILLPAYDGNPFSRWRYQGPKNEFHEVRVSLVQVEPISALPTRAIEAKQSNPRLARIGSRHGEARETVGRAPGIPLIATVDVYAYVRAEDARTGGEGEDGGIEALEGFGDETVESGIGDGLGQVVEVDEALGF